MTPDQSKPGGDHASAESKRANSPGALRTYLAQRDVSCHECGYNLKGVMDLFCPECGVVIPRPPADEARADRGETPRRLWCRKCGYMLADLKAERCPECGESALIAMEKGEQPEVKRWKWLSRGIPISLVAPGVVALPVAAALIVRAAGAPSLWSGKGAERMVGGVFALVPPLICVLWFVSRRKLMEMPPTFRRMFAGCAALVSLAVLLGAAAFLMV